MDLGAFFAARVSLPLQTPAALVDLDRVSKNLERIAAYLGQHRLGWRPHAKTHKSSKLAALQLAAGARGLTVATCREAEVMGQVCDDVLYAYPPFPGPRLERVLALPRRVRITTTVDGLASLEALGAACARYQREVDVLVELDLGMRRLGVGSAEAAVTLARAIGRHRHLRYEGVLFYPGHLRGPIDAAGQALGQLSEQLSGFLEALAAAGLPARTVSGGSTPTLWRSHQVRGLTELRAGINVLNDRNSAAVGACAWDECAYFVLATVVSTAVAGQVVIDAGSKALAREEGLDPSGGYGALVEDPRAVIGRVSEEHGIIELGDSAWRPRLGEQVRVVPNHVCASVALHPRLHLLRGGQLDGAWPVEARDW
jgi:D-serine deaminase-like pyridoxal phosphate-dependent protein